MICGQNRVRDAGERRDEMPVPGRGPPDASSTALNGVPHSTSSTPQRCTSPTIVTITVPGDSGVPIERNQLAPFARMCAAAASVSTLSTTVGLLRPAWPGLTSASHPSCTVANRPRCQGGSNVGSGSRPSITSRSAFSSPNRYSSGPSTIETLRSPSSPIVLISSAARRSALTSRAYLRLVAEYACLAPTANAAMASPSMTRYGSRRMRIRSLKVAGSPSAPFATA